jgi:glucose 1-dehydrogenase
MSRDTPDVAIISGALGDIGRAIALELARAGARIALSDVQPHDMAVPTLRAIDGIGGRARYDQVDVTDGPGVRDWVDAVRSDLGTPNLVIPNAGTVTVGSVDDLDDGAWSHHFDVNLNGAFFLAQAAARHLVHDRIRGHVVFIGSWAAHAPDPKIPAYCASKAALRMLCRCLALELAPHGILVNEVAPGYVDAGLSRRVFDQTPGARTAARDRVPIGSLLSPDDVARYVRLLCSPDNTAMTGAALVVDGGLSLLAADRHD